MSSNIPKNKCDTTVNGDSDRVNTGNVDRGIIVESSGSTVNADVSEASEPVAVIVENEGNRVVLDGSDKDINLYVESDGNSIVVDNNANIERHGSGSGNSVRRKDLETEGIEPKEVVTRTREEALDNKGLFGSTTLNYQKPREKDDRCVGCGSTGVSTVDNYTEKLFVLFGYPIRLDITDYVECENCHNVELSDDEWSNTIN